MDIQTLVSLMAIISTMAGMFAGMFALLRRELGFFRSEVKSDLLVIGTKVTELDHKVTQLNTKVTELDHQITRLDHKVTELDHRVTDLSKDVSTLSERVTTLDDRVFRLAAGIKFYFEGPHQVER